MGASVSKMDGCLYGLSAIPLGLAFLSQDLERYDAICRPLLNVCWGYLFGSTIWLGFVQRFMIKELDTVPENRHDKLTPLDHTTSFLLKTSTIASGALFLSTACLAPGSALLLRSSLLNWMVCMANSSIVHPASTKKSWKYSDLASKCSGVLSFTTIAALVPYALM